MITRIQRHLILFTLSTIVVTGLNYFWLGRNFQEALIQGLILTSILVAANYFIIDDQNKKTLKIKPHSLENLHNVITNLQFKRTEASNDGEVWYHLGNRWQDKITIKFQGGQWRIDHPARIHKYFKEFGV